MPDTAVAYAMSDLAPGEHIDAGTVSVPAGKGGCGSEHHIKVNDENRPYLDCPACSTYMVGNHYGWANTPHGVPLTPDEQGEVEITKRDGETSYRLAMKAMGDAVGQIVQGTRGTPLTAATPAPPSLMEQLAAMTPADRAALKAILTDEPALPAPAPAVTVAAHPGEVTVGEPQEPVRRKPGRPRKTAD